MTYRERATAVPGVLLWQRTASGPARILPDGCLDLIWDGRRLIVAGPDTAARWNDCEPDMHYVGLRFHYGIGPALLDVPASDVVDRSPLLDELWASAAVRRLGEQVADDPAPALTAWLTSRVDDRVDDPLGRRVHAMADQGVAVARMADQLGLSERQLHRRCLPAFGYGPRRLARILRLNRALAEAGAGRPLAQVAADCGYADQAHLCRDVLALTGATPTELVVELRQRREELDRVAVGVAD